MKIKILKLLTHVGRSFISSSIRRQWRVIVSSVGVSPLPLKRYQGIDNSPTNRVGVWVPHRYGNRGVSISIGRVVTMATTLSSKFCIDYLKLLVLQHQLVVSK